MVILFMKAMKDLWAKEDDTATTKEEYFDALNFQKKPNGRKNRHAKCNPCISLCWGMWERVDESWVGLQEVNVRIVIPQSWGHTCQWTLPKDVQLSKWVCALLKKEYKGNAASGGGITKVKHTQTPEKNTILETAPHKQPGHCKGRSGNHSKINKSVPTWKSKSTIRNLSNSRENNSRRILLHNCLRESVAITPKLIPLDFFCVPPPFKIIT